MGAKLNYHLAVQKKTNDAVNHLSAYVKASGEVTIKGVDLGAERELGTDLQFKEHFYMENTYTSTKAGGGNAVYAQNIHTEGNYEKWHDSINSSNLVWIDYYDNSLCPIYEFIEDEEKKENFKNTYDELLANSVITVVNSEFELELKIIRLKAQAKDVGGNVEYAGTITYEKGTDVKYLFNRARNNYLRFGENATIDYAGHAEKFKFYSLNETFTIKMRIIEVDDWPDKDDIYSAVDKVFTVKEVLDKKEIELITFDGTESLTVYFGVNIINL